MAQDSGGWRWLVSHCKVLTPEPMLQVHTCFRSETGGRSRNEDACGYWQSGPAACWVLSDGAGGHGSGDLAARLVVQTVLQAFQEQPEASGPQAQALLQQAQQAVRREKTSGATRDDMHATAALLLLDRERGQGVFAHVGDSRLYQFRQGRILRQTRDHSLVQQLVDAGYWDAAQIRSHPQRNLLTSAIGAADPLEISVSPQAFEVLAGDVFLLCSDGWWEWVDEAGMESTLACQPSRQPVGRDWLDAMAARIAHTASARHDNYSALCVACSDDRTLLALQTD